MTIIPQLLTNLCLCQEGKKCWFLLVLFLSFFFFFLGGEGEGDIGEHMKSLRSLKATESKDFAQSWHRETRNGTERQQWQQDSHADSTGTGQRQGEESHDATRRH